MSLSDAVVVVGVGVGLMSPESVAVDEVTSETMVPLDVAESPLLKVPPVELDGVTMPVGPITIGVCVICVAVS